MLTACTAVPCLSAHASLSLVATILLPCTQGVGKAFTASDVPREELFIISKVWNDTIYKGPEAVRAQVEKCIKDLGTYSITLHSITLHAACSLHWADRARACILSGGTPLRPRMCGTHVCALCVADNSTRHLLHYTTWLPPPPPPPSQGRGLSRLFVR